ncbi:MAG: hypothetical protein QXQ47_06785, partial [Candidatus Bathyarchaeia archaeon]
MDESFEPLVKALLDYLNSQEEAIKQLKVEIGKVLGLAEETAQPKREWSWNPSAIKWEKAQGARGEYEKSEDVNNPEFKKMLKDLAEHKGRLSRDGFFYWTYKNGSTVGRKPKSKV